MLDKKPYFVNAIYQWITDSGFTPYILVLVDSGVVVPVQYVKDGKIVLNISMGSTNGLTFDKEAIAFGCRFSGKHHNIYVPFKNVLAIYARENGEGMFFEQMDEQVKNDVTDFVVNKLNQMVNPENPTIEMTFDFSDVEQKKPEDKPPTKPTLKVVK